MAIKDRSELKFRKIEIDLSGSDGNAWVLMGIASRIYKKLSPEVIALKLDGKSEKEIMDEMMSGDYENLVAVLEKYFGEWVDIYK